MVLGTEEWRERGEEGEGREKDMGAETRAGAERGAGRETLEDERGGLKLEGGRKAMVCATALAGSGPTPRMTFIRHSNIPRRSTIPWNYCRAFPTNAIAHDRSLMLQRCATTSP